MSAVVSKGQRNALKIFEEDGDVKQAFLELSESWELSEEFFQHLERFTCRLYSKRGQSDVEDL